MMDQKEKQEVYELNGIAETNEANPKDGISKSNKNEKGIVL